VQQRATRDVGVEGDERRRCDIATIDGSIGVVEQRINSLVNVGVTGKVV
jgi:hypothetical protein